MNGKIKEKKRKRKEKKKEVKNQFKHFGCGTNLKFAMGN